MTGFPWLPIGTPLPGGLASARLIDAGPAWQVCAAGVGGRLALLLRHEAGPDWWATELAALGEAAGPLAEVEGLLCLPLPGGARPWTLAGLALRDPALGRTEAEALATALAALQRRCPQAGWSSALFLPEPGFLLATQAGAADDQAGAADNRAGAADDRAATLAAALSGGVRDPGLTPARIAQLNPRLDPATAARVLGVLGAGAARRPAPDPDNFHLPGQPALERLLREQVLDVLHRPAEYARLGVPAPAGVLLAGPPGCGKSFAAGRLAAFLGWPLHEVSVASVGSAWLHETSRKLADAFASAAAESPAVVLLEELDALGKSRAAGFGATAEEVNTLLRLVEQAPARGLLVVGTTNRPEAIDPALRRRGRFDLLHVMDHADEHGMAEVLRALLDARPHAPTLDIAAAARRLARRPASDAAWVVNEAARLTVRGGHTAIDDLMLARALQGLGLGAP